VQQFRAILTILASGLLAAACASSSVERGPSVAASASRSAGGSAVMIAAARPLQCVPYARRLSGLDIRGDAWSWWPAAEGRYLRAHSPAVGAVLVLSKTQRLRYGHLAVVTRIIGPREVLVEHANWLNRGMIHRNVPVVDVSPANDWSQVRLWYVPGNHLGGHVYPASGFIHPVTLSAASD
jgi:surface antigen